MNPTILPLSPLEVVAVILLTMSFGIPYLYYEVAKRWSRKRWNLLVDNEFIPTVTVIIPTYNEAVAIGDRLRNLAEISYPRDKLQVIVVDSASTDGTSDVAGQYLKAIAFPFPAKILKQEERAGKGNALNFALKHASGEIVATSDADSHWGSGALLSAVRYMADPRVGAVTGKEVITNEDFNFLTKGEALYKKAYDVLRIGESKTHSTLIFDGEFSLYRRSALDKFEDQEGSDDCGTVVEIVSRGYRAIFASDARYFDAVPYTLRGRMIVKIRRAQHLILSLLKAVRLKTQNSLPVPGSIVFSNLYLHVVNPITSLAGLTLAGIFVLRFPFILLGALPILFVERLRAAAGLFITGNVALVVALLKCLAGDRQIVWKRIDETRHFPETLTKHEGREET